MKIFEGFQKGVNLGGWISQFAVYDHEHFKTFITEKDIADIAALGFDHVRVPVDYNVLEDEEGNRLDSGFQYLENCYTWCRKHNLNMLVDLHECYGYSFDPLKKTWTESVSSMTKTCRLVSCISGQRLPRHLKMIRFMLHLSH